MSVERLTCGLLLAAVLIGNATADPYHHINLLVGDRAAGLGGAYVAVADDPAGLYYNPAGIAYGGRANLSASMNAYHIIERRYRNVLGGRDWVRRSSALLPNFFGVTQPLGPGVIGFSYAVPDAIAEDQNQQIPGVPTILAEENATYTINFTNQDTTYLAGPSYALPLSPRLAVGLTLYGHLRSQKIIINQQFTFSDPSRYHWENSYSERSEYGLRPLLGLMYTPLERLSLGLTLARTWILSADEFDQLSCAGMNGYDYGGGLCQGGALQLIRQQRPLQRRLPWSATVGAAYFPSPTLLVSAQLSLYQDLAAGGLPQWNLAGGAEYYLTPRLALRLGLFSDNANTAEIRPGRSDQDEHIDLLGASMSLSRFTRTTSLTLGANFRAGEGQAQILNGQNRIQTVTARAVTVFVASSYSY